MKSRNVDLPNKSNLAAFDNYTARLRRLSRIDVNSPVSLNPLHFSFCSYTISNFDMSAAASCRYENCAQPFIVHYCLALPGTASGTEGLRPNMKVDWRTSLVQLDMEVRRNDAL